jgi:hypothetical protein
VALGSVNAARVSTTAYNAARAYRAYEIVDAGVAAIHSGHTVWNSAVNGADFNPLSLVGFAPEFEELLSAVPEADRNVRVFLPMPIRNHGRPLLAHRVGRLIAEIGEAASVKVDVGKRCGKERTKFASGYDLHQSFGERWSTLVMPRVLMEPMRQASIETTMKFYVGRKVATTSDAL